MGGFGGRARCRPVDARCACEAETMSIHKSLVSKTKLTRHRNVLTRGERIEELKAEGKWEDGRSVFGLPKVRVMRVKKRSKRKKKET